MGPRIELKEELCDRVEESDFIVASGGFAQLSAGRHSKLIVWANRISSSILRFSSKVSQVDLFDTQAKRPLIKPRQVSRQHFNDTEASRALDAKGNINQRSSFSERWPNLIYAITLFSMTKMLLNIYFQYQYDRHLLRLRWALKHSELKVSLDLSALKMQLEASRHRLKFIGAPHLNATIAIECTYITIVQLCLIVYLLGYLYFRYVERYDFYLLRSILDRGAEQRRCNKMILEQINKFIESRRNLTNICLKKCSIIKAFRQQQPERVQAMRNLKHKLLLDHQLVIKQFKLMANYGALVPLNRTHAWIDLMSLIFCVFNCACYVWSIFFNVVFYTLLSRLGRFQVESKPLDLVFSVDLLIVSTMITFGLTFYLSTCLVSCIDQAKLISQVRKLVLECIQINKQMYLSKVPHACGSSATFRQTFKWHQITGQPFELRPNSFGPLTRPVDLSGHHKLSQLNANLLLTIMHYKIFVVQLKPVLKPVAFVCFVSICVMLLHPILIRLHTPYLDSVALKQRYYLISLIAVFFVNCNILPVCYINSRCLDLNKALFSLLAHTIEISLLQVNKNHPRAASCGDQELRLEQRQTSLVRVEIYDPHSVCSLRRELKTGHRFVRQFETRTMGLTFTYANLLRIYFWLGAIVLSIFLEPSELENTNSASVLSNFLKDPLGLYNF